MSDKELDDVLCMINGEYLEIKNSRAYHIGLRIIELFNAIKSFHFTEIFNMINERRVRKKYNKSNENFLTMNCNINIPKDIVVYTVIVGDYDNLIEPVYAPQGTHFFVITDMEVPKDSYWEKIDINDIEEIKNLDNSRKSRYPKIHPEVFFPDYEYSVYIDANFKVIGSLSKYVRCIGGIPIAFNWHPYRNSIYSEAEACIKLKKDDPNVIKKQMEYYRKEGMPNNFGLIEANMIVRKHNDKVCINLMEDWWQEICKWSRRDQLSLPYVIWKNGYTMKDFGFIGTNVRNNTSLQILSHISG